MNLRKLVTTPSAGASLLALWATPAQAHDGHGLTGAHWHASDSWGFVALGVLVVAALGSSRRDK